MGDSSGGSDSNGSRNTSAISKVKQSGKDGGIQSGKNSAYIMDESSCTVSVVKPSTGLASQMQSEGISVRIG